MKSEPSMTDKPSKTGKAAAKKAPAGVVMVQAQAAETAIATVQQAAEAAAEPVTEFQKGPTMTDTATKTAETAQNFAAEAQNRAEAMFADVNARAKAALEKSTKLFEELNDFNKGNVEALVESSKVAAKAAETLGQQAADTARKNFETATAALKSFASAKSPTEFFQMQSDFARNAFDALIADTSRNSETVLKLAGDVFQPISNRFAVAAEKLKTAA